MEGDTLYRSIDGCRGVEDVRPESSTGNGAEEKPRLIGSWPRRKLKDNSTSGSPILLARYAQRRPSPRLRMRDMYEIQAESNAGGWQNADAGSGGTLGKDMCEHLWTLAAFKARHQMLLVLIDRLSKWTELVPLRSATGNSLKKSFRERIIARYGVPKVVVTDNGVQFASRIFKSFLAEMHTKQQLTDPYTPQENPTERENRTVKTMIAQFAGQDQKNWDEKWP